MKRTGRSRRSTKVLLVEGVDFKTIRAEGVDIGDGTSNECGLSAISETESPLLSDTNPQKGDIIMYRTTISDCGGETKYKWERAKVLNVGDPLEANNNLSAAVLRMNPSKKNHREVQPRVVLHSVFDSLPSESCTSHFFLYFTVTQVFFMDSIRLV